MTYKYFKMHDSCYRVTFDDEDLPGSCEKFDFDEGTFKECDYMLPDVMESHQSILISEKQMREFLTLS